MFDLLWLIVAVPLAGFACLAIFGKRLPTAMAAAIGVGTVGASAALSLLIAAQWHASPPDGGAYSLGLWQWIDLRFAGWAMSSPMRLYLDPLSLLMIVVVSCVGFLIHLYSAGFMKGDEGFSRYFAYMNLFVAAMLTLVLADNLVMLLVGWEGVGLCSFLLIGFWYRQPANARAARKAFIVTRVGDTAFMIGLLLLFTQLGTLDIQDVMRRASDQWLAGSKMATLAAALLLGGAIGKSAQLPLQTWLPDAMAGPTPVSALIHAATMVTAGVYLIARTHTIFMLAPQVLQAVGVIGAATLLYAGCSALAQRDIKRILAYSTISQIGYMFLALGVGAFGAAMFHFMTHAFFKSLLFLAAGVVILAMHEEHDIFKMGGLRPRMPATFWTFLIGACSLSAVPLVTAGFYSKDLILEKAWSSGQPVGRWLFAAGLLGAFITSVYSFRMVFVTFFGPPRGELAHKPGRIMVVPLVILAALSIVVGFVELPATMGDTHNFTDFLSPVFREGAMGGGGAVSVSETSRSTLLSLQFASGAASILGILVAYVLYVARPGLAGAIAGGPVGSVLRRWWLAGWGFDWLYERLFVRPFVWVARVNREDFIDSFFDALAAVARGLNRVAVATQTGRLRWYAAGVVAGTILIILLAVLL